MYAHTVHSTGNYIQYLAITMMEKNLKENMYAYVSLNHFAVHLKLMQYCKSTVLQLKIERDFRHGPLTGQLAVKTLHWWSGEDDSPGHTAVESWFEETHD